MATKKTSFKIPPIKKTPVTRKFLNDLARSIYDSKTRKFLRLCDGTLQNGPDPTNPKRPMHCGLGELYFAMTGHQPEWDGVDENDVINLAVERSELHGVEEARCTARDKIRLMDVPQALKTHLLEALSELEDEDIDDAETQFRQVLDDIPGENDDGCGDDGESCTLTTFRERSKRVAAKLREAAKLLPA